MVEMTETANILNNATDSSLVLMDEIGRGTSTYDGLSLAWASAVQIASSIKAYTLFATHYFELTTLAVIIPEIVNVHLNAVEHDKGIVFLHAVETGPANQSYGLQVAQLAGMPAKVLEKARKKLQQLENEDKGKHPDTGNSPLQNELFVQQTSHPAVDLLNEISPDDLSPRQALDLLYKLKELSEN